MPASLPSAASYRSDQGVDVDLRPHDVVGAGVDGDQVGLERDRRLDLLGDHGVELAAADREVGVAEVVGAGCASTLGHPVGPAAQAVGAVGSGSPTPSVKESPRAT